VAHKSMLSPTAIDGLVTAVLQVLERVGVFCQNDEILGALASWGAQVDLAGQTARFPQQAVLDFVGGLRREEVPTSQEPCRGFRAPALPRLSTQIAQFYLDHHTGERRAGNREDFVTLIKLGDVLHREEGVGHSLLLTEVPPLLEPLEAALLLAQYTRNPAGAFAWDVRQVDYLTEMGEFLDIHNWFTWGAICFAHPLRFDKEVADKFVRRVRSGTPTGLTGMPVSGVTTPVTPAGFIVVAAAEFLATWIAARALNPTVAFEGSIWGGSVDFRTGAVSYSSPDAMLRAFALAEFLERWSGRVVPVGGGEYCDARSPGLYAALEKAYKAMTIAAFTGRHPPVGEGMLETGKTISPAQILIERELAGGVQMLASEIEVTPETIALDTILDVGFGLERNYMGAEHTVRHHRQTHWYPALVDRVGWNGAGTEAATLEKATRKVDALLASYRKLGADPDTLARMRRVVRRAQRNLA
jgi:trimethylamine:corrinoid methyltransferase-like protein